MPDRVLVDGRDHRSHLQTEDELAQQLADIDTAAQRDGQPLIATLYYDADADDPPFLSIGLGAVDSILIHTSGLANNESGFSRGPRDGDTTEVLYRYGTTINAYQRWMLIDKHVAINAAKEFFRTGRRPTDIQWADI